jgi:stress-induced-phosphoprotein 1
LKIDPANAQAKSGLESVKRAMDSEASNANPMRTFANSFQDPQLIQKLARNPKTSGLLADQDFMSKLQRFQQNPDSFGAAEFQDPRFLQVFGVLMGLDMSFGAPPAGASSSAPGATNEDEDEEMPDLMPPRPSSTAQKKAPEPVPEPEPEDEEEKAKKEAKAAADEEKRLGTENYKKRNFDAAIEHYTKAWDLHQDITYLTNLGAAYFEKKDYEKCIEACKKAIEEGRFVHTDFKIMAK